MMEYDRKWEYNSNCQETITESLLRDRPDIVEAIREFDRKHTNVVKEHKNEENEQNKTKEVDNFFCIECYSDSNSDRLAGMFACGDHTSGECVPPKKLV